MNQDAKSSGDELIEALNQEHVIKMLVAEKQLAEAKLRASTVHNRVLWFSLSVVTVINLILAWGAVRHMRLWH